MIEVRAGDPGHPDAVQLLRASHALMEASFPEESNHYLPLEALGGSDIRFFHGHINGALCGVGAIKLFDNYAEIKSMFTDEAARGQGLADAILTELTRAARAEGKVTLRLETGDTLHAAHRLYARHGFARCQAFGTYRDDPRSVFMQKSL